MESTILIKTVKDAGSTIEVTYADKGKDWTKKAFKNIPGIEHLVANKMVTWTLEKSDKGYWNVTNIRPAILPEPPQTPVQPQSTSLAPVVQSQAYYKPNSDPNKDRGVALRMAVDFAIAKIGQKVDVRPVGVLNVAKLFEGFITGGIVPEEQIVTPVIEKKPEPGQKPF